MGDAERTIQGPQETCSGHRKFDKTAQEWWEEVCKLDDKVIEAKRIAYDHTRTAADRLKEIVGVLG